MLTVKLQVEKSGMEDDELLRARGDCVELCGTYH